VNVQWNWRLESRNQNVRDQQRLQGQLRMNYVMGDLCCDDVLCALDVSAHLIHRIREAP
jgi:hypothetical protein